MGESDLCAIDKTVPEALDDREEIMVLWREDELGSLLSEDLHCYNWV
jgi:hypothetical protein